MSQMVADKESIRAYPRNQRTNQFLRVLCGLLLNPNAGLVEPFAPLGPIRRVKDNAPYR